MGFLDPTPEEITTSVLRNSVQGARASLLSAFRNGQEYVWQNAYGLTPAQVFAIMGSDAAMIVAWSAAVLQLLASDPTMIGQYTVLQPSAAVLTPNQDGTVTLSGV